MNLLKETPALVKQESKKVDEVVDDVELKI